MSKRSEEKAIAYADEKLQRVDPELWETGYSSYRKMGVRVMDGSDVEEAYQDGYEQAEKDVWKRIVKYLSKRNATDLATVGWILNHIEEYKKKIMEKE